MIDYLARQDADHLIIGWLVCKLTLNLLAVFLRRYGQPPRYVFDGLGGLLLVGPVPGLEGGA